MNAAPRSVVHEDAQTPRRRRRLRCCSTGSRRRRGAARSRTSGSPAAASPRPSTARSPGARSTPSVDWSRVVFWWGDERFVEAGSPDRNARQAREAFLDGLGVDPGPRARGAGRDEVATAEDAAAAYCAGDARAGRRLLRGADARRRPGRPHRLALPRPPRAGRHATRSPSPSTTPPSRRRTGSPLTFEAMERCRAVWFLVSGDGKADAVAPRPRRRGLDRRDPRPRRTSADETVWLARRGRRLRPPADRALSSHLAPPTGHFLRLERRRPGTPRAPQRADRALSVQRQRPRSMYVRHRRSPQPGCRAMPAP